jgi:hypothetical protein
VITLIVTRISVLIILFYNWKIYGQETELVNYMIQYFKEQLSYYSDWLQVRCPGFDSGQGQIFSFQHRI